jgi:hypothetical protein
MKPIEYKMAVAMDNFIRSTGGNLDHRAANDRDRKALLSFLQEVLSFMSHHQYADIELVQAASTVIHNRLGYKLTGKEK